MAGQTKREIIEGSLGHLYQEVSKLEIIADSVKDHANVIWAASKPVEPPPVVQPPELPAPPATSGGRVIEGKTFNSTLSQFADGDIYRWCTFNGHDTSLYCVNAQYKDGRHVTFNNCLFTGAVNKAVLGHHFTMTGCTVEDCQEDGIFICGDDVNVSDTLIQRLGTKFGAHADGVQIGCGDNINLYSNRIIVPHEPGHSSNAAIYIESDFGRIGGVSIRDNVLDGGGYTLFVRKGKYGEAGVLIVESNEFLRYYYATHIGLALNNTNNLEGASSNKPA